ncbi:DEAD/DEAH box helicase [Methanocaldococcus indicus]|uniref:DEAD/DEAH box helicase n=1 Tax=Methanocaldococcus indicus TaxID=213231 RepID=UPI003C6D60B4
MKYINHPLIKPNTLEARLYQQLIAANALKRNTLVVIPTGLGKTAIAVLVIAGILTKKDGKILILAPTRPLVEQHYRRLKEILNIDEDKIVALTGKISPKKREEIYKKAKIIIATPQVIENDILSNRINIDDFILLIADEAHHTVGNHAYAFVAKKFKDKCHILALTASPGSDIEKVMEICENLNIQHIEMRDEDDEDVKPYIAKVKLYPIRIELPNEFKKALKLLDKAIKERLKFLKENGAIDTIQITKTELIELNPKLFAYDDSIKYDLIRVCSEALKLMHAKELLESQGKSIFLDYIEKLKNNRSKSARAIVNDENVKQAVLLLKKSNVEHPKLNKVLELIKKILKKNPNEKIILFTQYRATVEKLLELLNKEGIKAIRFVGQSNKEGKGMSQKEQIEAIEKFKEEGNVLVSTSVSEEGIDIPSVNYIIFYEPVPSEIRLIQRRGRAMRGEGGICYVLIAKGTSDEAYYRASLYKERAMKRILREIYKEIKNRLEEKYGKLEESNIQEDKESNKEDKKDNEESHNKINNEIKEEKKDEIKKPKTILDYLKIAEKKSKEKESIESENNIILTKIDNKKEKKAKIIVDVREKGIAKYLSDKVDVEIKTLDVGDFVLSDRVVVERKTGEDFINSIIDKRLFNQLKELKRYEKPILIIEGDYKKRLHENAIRGAILSIILDYSIPIIFTKDLDETISYLVQIAEKEQIKEKRPILIRAGKKPMTLKERQEFIVQSLPEVGGALAKNLLKHFKTVENVFTAKEEELIKVEGVGKERAKKIREVLTAEYK